MRSAVSRAATPRRRSAGRAGSGCTRRSARRLGATEPVHREPAGDVVDDGANPRPHWIVCAAAGGKRTGRGLARTLKVAEAARGAEGRRRGDRVDVDRGGKTAGPLPAPLDGSSAERAALALDGPGQAVFAADGPAAARAGAGDGGDGCRGAGGSNRLAPRGRECVVSSGTLWERGLGLAASATLPWGGHLARTC